METSTALACFHALSQETRLRIFRLLVQKGKPGLAAGAISQALDCPTSTLSFHLKILHAAQLISLVKKGRSMIYAANFASMNALMAFLTENCCGGVPCDQDPQISEETP